jgi:hypothetical protein
VDKSDMLIAIWDGKPAAGLGGTADAVGYALERRIKILQLNPVTHKLIERGKTE